MWVGQFIYFHCPNPVFMIDDNSEFQFLILIVFLFIYCLRFFCLCMCECVCVFGWWCEANL